jgi:hypothetical protein
MSLSGIAFQIYKQMEVRTINIEEQTGRLASNLGVGFPNVNPTYDATILIFNGRSPSKYHNLKLCP